ncbi:sex comb on midleg-like protein 1 [Striga asiatica]|uniref:Sex comb on midleg-like protein 1 n=1 Tax=Striga asiatica TaxID=4170 RepID=A0A5A7P6U2_STRAF|nr:sex comb on midleg-like protein 1 [Striga asiatica]
MTPLPPPSHDPLQHCAAEPCTLRNIRKSCNTLRAKLVRFQRGSKFTNNNSKSILKHSSRHPAVNGEPPSNSHQGAEICEIEVEGSINLPDNGISMRRSGHLGI